MTAECLMDDGAWKPCELLRTDSRYALLRHREITWWAAPGEWRFPVLPAADRAQVAAIEATGELDEKDVPACAE